MSSGKELEGWEFIKGLYGKNDEFQEKVNVSSSSRVKSSVVGVFGGGESFVSIIFMPGWVLGPET